VVVGSTGSVSVVLVNVVSGVLGRRG